MLSRNSLEEVEETFSEDLRVGFNSSEDWLHAHNRMHEQKQRRNVHIKTNGFVFMIPPNFVNEFLSLLYKR